MLIGSILGIKDMFTSSLSAHQCALVEVLITVYLDLKNIDKKLSLKSIYMSRLVNLNLETKMMQTEQTKISLVSLI